MKKILISADNLDEHICRELGRIYVDNNTILTAGAKDELTRRHIAIVRCTDAKAEQHGCAAPSETRHSDAHVHCGQAECGHGQPLSDQVEEMLIGVAAILKQECGITDPEELKSASLRVFKALRASLKTL